jgi:hypothetical protein
MDWNQLASSKPITAYSIFCGVLEYPENVLKEIKSGNKYGFKDWEIHENPYHQSSEEIIRNFKDYYYESFVDTVFPHFKSSDKQQLNSDFAKQTYRLSLKIDQQHPIQIKKKETATNYNVYFEYLDLFFFPDGVVYYCFKCDFSSFSFDEITLLNNHIRNADKLEDMDFLKTHLSFLQTTAIASKNTDIQSFGNKLKVFSVIEYNAQLTKEEENMLLYDIGACVPIGSASGEKPYFQPSEDYFNDLIENNKISVFNNWSALTLFDTFTGLFQKGALYNFNWENGYFNLIYLQSLYVKNHLFKVNKAFYATGAKHQQLDDDLFEFNKYYNPSHISFNFLPSIIFNKIRYSLAIDNELNLLKEGIERANRKSKEKRDKTINNILRIIALLAVFSVIWDVSEWLNKIFSGGTTSYNIISGSLTVIVLLIFGIFLLKNYRKKS